MLNEKNMRLEKATIQDRLYAIFIDYFIILVLPNAIIALFNYEFNYNVMKYVSMLYILIIFKDVTGQSIGKKILGIKIVNKNDYTKKVNPIVTIVRNIFLLFGIIEPLIILITGGKRIGDILTNTIVAKIYKDPS